jgi:hypothetical protein
LIKSADPSQNQKERSKKKKKKNKERGWGGGVKKKSSEMGSRGRERVFFGGVAFGCYKKAA